MAKKRIITIIDVEEHEPQDASSYSMGLAAVLANGAEPDEPWSLERVTVYDNVLELLADLQPEVLMTMPCSCGNGRDVCRTCTLQAIAEGREPSAGT